MIAHGYHERSVTAQSSEPAAKATDALNDDAEIEAEFPRLIRDKWVTSYNGAKLDLLESSWADESAYLRASVIDGAEVQPIGRRDLLVSYGDALYRLNADLKPAWEYRTAQFVIDFEFIPSRNLIYVTAGDNIMAILNAETGEEIYSNGRNGSAAYGVAKQFGEDTCLVTDNFRMYREKFRPGDGEPMRDGIACWRGNEELWQMDFPPDAELVVDGKRIVAVTKSKDAIYVKEISPPANVDD